MKTPSRNKPFSSDSVSRDEDNALVRRALKGDRKAFEMIILKYQQPLLNYLGRLTGEREQAQDFTQEVFLKVHASLSSFQPRFKFSTWLFKIASNFMIDFWRKKKISAVSLDRTRDDGENSCSLQVPDAGPPVAKKYELTQIKKRIEGSLERVPEELRELFVLRHINEFSYEEIAEIKGLPVGTVKNRVFQTKEMLRGLLEEGS
jgi:RNA polymerase sigma-70 factor (ECF subfamily)